jgi:hypothetical protein
MKRWLVLAIVGLASVAGVTAWAAIPDAGGVIHVCYKNSGGAMRVIDTGLGQTCANNETSLNWDSANTPNGLLGYTRVVTNATVAVGNEAEVNANCPEGYHVLGGGYSVNDNPAYYAGDLDIHVVVDTPSGTSPNEGWRVNVFNESFETTNVQVIATCAQ